MKKLIFIAVISLLLMHCGISYNICSPYGHSDTTEINTTIGQELMDLQQALDTGAITQEESRAIASSTNESQGCTTVGEGPLPNAKLQRGINISRVKFLRTYIEGGALGPVGHISSQTSSNNTYNKSISGSMTADNYYGGYVNSAGTASLDWQLSFLDKDHTIIADVNKDEELFDGIGSKGVAILPENSHIKVKQNLYIYLKKAGLIDNAPEGISNIIIE